MQEMTQIISILALLVTTIIFILGLVQRLAKLETKVDWLLQWIICLDEGKTNNNDMKNLMNEIKTQNGFKHCGETGK